MSVLVWLIPGAIVLVLWGVVATRRARRGDVLGRRETNIALYRQRQAEIVLEKTDDDEGRALEVELGVQLATDEATVEPQLSREEDIDTTPERLGIRPALGVGAAIAALTVVLYFVLGDPSAEALKPVRGWVESEDPADWLRAEQVLAERAQSGRENADIWYYLGHVRFKQERYDDAAAAFRRVTLLVGPSENVDLFLAQSIFIANQGALGDEGREILDRLLATSGDQAWALELLTLDAARRGDLQAAVQFANRMLGVGLPPERKAMFVEMERQLRARLANDRPQVAAEVDVAGAGRFPWLFVTARPAAGGPPIVAVRRSVDAGDSSVAVVLDDLVSMMPSNLLSSHERVVVEARLSTSSRAVDPEADVLRSDVVEAVPGDRPAIALTFPGEKTTPGIEVSLTVRVELGDDVRDRIDAANTVFVIVRNAAGGPPLAVRKVRVADFPTEVVITDADVMLPGNSLALSRDITVMARLSRTGDAMPAPGDIQSEALRHDDLNKTLTVVLERVVDA